MFIIKSTLSYAHSLAIPHLIPIPSTDWRPVLLLADQKGAKTARQRGKKTHRNKWSERERTIPESSDASTSVHFEAWKCARWNEVSFTRSWWARKKMITTTLRRGWRPMAGCRDSRLRLQTSFGLCMMKYPKYRFNKYDFRRKAHWFKKVYFNDKIVRISKCSSQWPTFAPTYDFQRTNFIQNRTSISYLLEPSLLQVSKSKI